MKKLDITSITDTSRMPVKKGTLQFLQDAYAEITKTVVQALIGPDYDPAVMYVLWGVVNSGTYPAYNTTAGAVFYNGEIFDIDAASFTASGTNVGVITQIQSQYTINADPVTFTDSAVRSIHNIRKMQLAQGVSGSGLIDFGQLFYLSFIIPPQLQLSAPTTETFAGNVLTITGAYPNMQLFVPTPPTGVNPILAAGTTNLGDVLGAGGSDYTISFPAPLDTSAYYVMGTLISQGANADVDTTVWWTIRGRSNASFILHCREAGDFAQNLAFDWIVFKK